MNKVFYFGPLKAAGHHLFDRDDGWMLSRNQLPLDFPASWSLGYDIDGCLQPGCKKVSGHWTHGQEVEGLALLHHVSGWTAISFWDRSVDKRGGCNSTFIARGTLTFDELLTLAKAQYPKRFALMTFNIVEAQP